MTYNPAVPGNWDGPQPTVVFAIQPPELVRYTDPGHLPFFIHWINFWANQNQYRNGANVRIDEEDGTTLRWYHAYFLPLGYYLANGITRLRPDQVHYGMRPVETSWPDELADYFDPIPPEYQNPEGIVGSGTLET